MARIAICSFNPTPSFCSAASNPFRCIPALPLRFPLKLSNHRLSARRSLTAVVTRYGGGSGPKEDGSDIDRDYDPALDVESLQSSSVRVLDQQQTMLGVMPIGQAIKMAEDADLTLAILSKDSDPPVLKLFENSDYEKSKYEQQKKKRVQQKRSTATRKDIKELKMGYNIGSHDYSVRLKAAKKFLKDGDKVKIIVNLKGRQNVFRNTAIELIQRFQSDIGELATEENKNFKERNIYMVLMPNKALVQKSQEEQKKKENPVTEVPASV